MPVFNSLGQTCPTKTRDQQPKPPSHRTEPTPMSGSTASLQSSSKQTTCSFGQSTTSIDASNIIDPKVCLAFEMSAAYFRVAQLRFGDIIPMIIYRYFVMKFVSSLESSLIQECDVLNDTSILPLLAEDPTLVEARKAWTAQITRLNELRDAIFNYV
ncbi:hypothetical protein DSO57_1029442 [Entomophthora muscae]|uniref:Uncharacterized protein n=1 Tax=Entomophthora muscae TaxID=34485 RepID=A0ACC2RSB5_9FUNG|nr:hypothetical protein DSO57_1029442 [Entomophthora muscae]